MRYGDDKQTASADQGRNPHRMNGRFRRSRGKRDRPARTGFEEDCSPSKELMRQLIEAGLAPKTVQTFAGHSSLQVTWIAMAISSNVKITASPWILLRSRCSGANNLDASKTEYFFSAKQIG
jgi:hypothetical protein